MVVILKEAKLAKFRAVRRGRHSRSKLFGTASRPRLAIFRSEKHIYAQLIDDGKAVTLAAASDMGLPKSAKRTKTEQAKAVAVVLAEKAKKIGLTKVVFDRGSYRYHGRIAVFAESARSGGLIF